MDLIHPSVISSARAITGPVPSLSLQQPEALNPSTSSPRPVPNSPPLPHRSNRHRRLPYGGPSRAPAPPRCSGRSSSRSQPAPLPPCRRARKATLRCRRVPPHRARGASRRHRHLVVRLVGLAGVATSSRSFNWSNGLRRRFPFSTAAFFRN